MAESLEEKEIPEKSVRRKDSLNSFPHEPKTDNDEWPSTLGFETTYQEREPVELAVSGTIPSYAAGVLYRTGPGGYQVKTDNGSVWSAGHWFDGLTQVHRFRIVPPGASSNSTRVFYNSRHTVDALIEHIRKTGSLENFTFARKQDPCQSFFKKVLSFFFKSGRPPMSNPGMYNIGVTLSANLPGASQDLQPSAGVNGHSIGPSTLHLKTDAALIERIDPETLEPIGVANQTILHPDLKGPLSAAHARTDPETGDLYNFNLDCGPECVYRIFSVSAATGKTTILASFPGTPAYLHSFFLTADHFVLCVWNSHISRNGISIVWHKNVLDAISPLDPSQSARWYVIDRKHGRGLLATYESPAFYCFHTINAWTEPSPAASGEVDIVADLAMYDNLDVLKRFYYENLVNGAAGAKEYQSERGDSTRPKLRRFRLPGVPSTPVKEVKQTTVDWTAPRMHSAELPTLNPAYVTRKHRYVYGVADRGKSIFVDGLVKYDCDTQTPHFWEAVGHSPGEPIFVADPEGTKEEDGVLLSVVLDGASGKSYLLCLDARDMRELGRAILNGAIGFGFHGLHVPVSGKSLVET